MPGKRKKGQESNVQSGRGFTEWANWFSSNTPFAYNPFIAPEPGNDAYYDQKHVQDVVDPAIFRAVLFTAARFTLSALYPKWAPYPSMDDKKRNQSDGDAIKRILTNPNFWARIAIGMPSTLVAFGKISENINGHQPPSWAVIPAGLAMLSWHIYQALPGNKNPGCRDRICGRNDDDDDANGQQPPPYAPPPVPLQPALPSVVQPAVQSQEEKRREEAAIEDARRVREFMARQQLGSGKKRKLSHNFSKLAKTCLCPTKRLKLSLRP